MRVYLAAVQSQLDPADYESWEGFERLVERLFSLALAEAPEGVPRLVAFPELFGLPLTFLLDAPEAARRAETTTKAALAWARELKLASPPALYRARALAVVPRYLEVFARAAKRWQSYVVAGTLLGPRLDREPARGWYALGPWAYNIGFLLSPTGRVMARPEKTRLTPDEAKALIRPGSWGGQVARTRIGTIATLICLDAFHESLVERADAAGAWLLVQPSANPAPWEGPWRPDPTRREGEAWLAEGLPKKLADRENLRYGLNPMLTGELYQLSFEGRSNLAAPGEVLAITPSPRGEGVAAALVEV